MNSFKYLGVVVDNKLCFKQHIDHTVYGCASKTNLNKIFLLQKRTLRTIFFRRKFDYITEKFSDYNNDAVFELFLDTVFKEIIYQRLGKLPLNFLDSFSTK